MSTRRRLASPIALTLGALASAAALSVAEEPVWRIHDMDRPRPPVITPAEEPAGAPSDAVVLFDGSDLAQWLDAKGGPAPWKVESGYIEVAPGTGPIHTKQGFGDVQLHLEFLTPPPQGKGQGRGNSGVFFMGGAYEIQVLDSYQNDTYPDGQAAAVYGQQPPLVNASRPPGQWQQYDIVFRRPRFENGALKERARFTVFHNGVLVQDGTQPTGPTTWQGRPPYQAHADALPIELQDHGNRMRFRNIWVRELPPPRPQPQRLEPPTPPVTDAGRYAGDWGHDGRVEVRLVAEDGGLWLYRDERAITSLKPDGDDRFAGTRVGVTLVFSAPGADGRPAKMEHSLGRETSTLERVGG